MNKIVLIISLMILVGCSSEAETPKSTSFQISLSDDVEQFELNDELSILGSVQRVEFINDQRIILTDNSPAIYLFEDYVMTASFGESGKGPCEFEEISAIELENGKLHLLDQSQTKIISFDIDTQQCIGEMNNKNLLGARYLHKETDSPSFIAGITSYSSLTPDSTILLHRVFEDESSEELDFRLSEINSVNVIVSIQSPRLDFKNFENKLHAYFPLADSLYSITLPDFAVSAFPLNIDIKRSELEKAGNGVNALLKVLRGDFESVNNLFVHKNWLAVQVVSNLIENELPNRSIQFYNHYGDFLTEYSLENEILTYRNNKFIEVVENSDPTSDFAFSIAYRSVITE